MALPTCAFKRCLICTSAWLEDDDTSEGDVLEFDWSRQCQVTVSSVRWMTTQFLW